MGKFFKTQTRRVDADQTIEVNIHNEIAAMIDLERRGILEQVDEILDEEGERLAEALRTNSPKLSGEYAAGWVFEKEGGRVVRNRSISRKTQKSKAGLGHLLEYGHLAKNGKVVGKRPHIYKQVNIAENRIEERLK